MQSSVEITSTLGRRLTVVVPAKDVEQKILKEEKKLAQSLRLPGFREGKAPQKLIKQQVGAQAHQNALSSVVEQSLSEAFKANKELEPATQPEIVNLKAEPGKDLSYEAIFDVYPEVKLPDFKTLEVEKYKATITEQDLENALEKIRKQLAKSEDTLAEVDQAFAKQIGAESADKQAIDKKIRELVENSLNNAIDNRLREEVISVLVKAIPLELPKALLENEVHNLHQQHHHQEGAEPEGQCHHEGLEEEAQKRVALGLILKQVIAQEKINLDQQRFQAKITDLLKFYPVEHLRGIVRELQNVVLADQAIDFVLSQVKVGEKSGTVDLLLN
jgi:FKBP-type peptidyl-prolyl cis-trans isomerase (trigger factor)